MTSAGSRLLAALAILLGSQLEGCSVRCDVPRCAARSASCQAQARDAVVCIRGGERPEVPIEVVSAERYLQQELDALDEVSEEELARRRTFYRGLALFGLLRAGLEPADAVATQTSDVAGFYDPDTREITVLEGGSAGEGSITLLIHELVHAQQDAEHDLGALGDDATGVDANAGLNAAIEGEASLYAGHAVAYALGFEVDEVEWSRFDEDSRRRAERYAIEADDPYFELGSVVSYAYGEEYARAAFSRGGQDEVAALLDAPPVSARQVMTGYGADPPGGEPWLDRELPEVAVPVLPELSLVGSTGLGAFGLRLLMQRGRGRASTSIGFERYLRGDVLSVLASADGDAVVAAYRMTFANEDAAAAVAEALDAAIPAAHEHLREGKSLIFLAHEQDVTLPELSSVSWTAAPEPTTMERSPAAPHTLRGCRER